MDLYYEKKMSAFITACEKRKNEAMRKIMNEMKDNINYTIVSSNPGERQGYTMLHIAVDFVEIAIAHDLLDNGADVTIKNAKGQTPLTALALGLRNGRYLMKSVTPEDAKLLNHMLSFHENNLVNPTNDKGLSHLHIACWCKNKTIVESFLKHSFDVNAVVSLKSKYLSGWTPLRVAIEYYDRDIVKLLLDNNADINVKDSNDLSPLYVALEKKDDDLINLLLESPNVKGKDFIDDTVGLSQLHFACIRNDKDKIETFSNKNVLINSQISSKSTRRAGFSPLHFAVLFNDCDMIGLLLNRGADITIRNTQEETPLHICESNEKIKFIIDTLVKKYNLKHGSFLLDFLLACKSNDVNKIDSLISEDMINDPFNSKSPVWPGFTLLHLAVEFDSQHVIKLLLDNGANIDSQDINGFTPIHLAFQKKQQAIVDLLFSYLSENIENPVDKRGLSHFHVACYTKNHRIIKKFLHQNSDLINSAITSDVFIDCYNHKAGETALHIVSAKGYKDTAKLLLKHGANILAENVNGLTPIHLATYVHKLLPNQLGTDTSEDEDELLYRKHEIIDTLLEKHMEINENPVDSNGLSHFHISCMTKNIKFVKNFIDKKVDVNTAIDLKSKFWPGYTPLHFVVQHSFSIDIVVLLVDHGANIEAKDKNGKTPLFMALEFCKNSEDEKYDDDDDDDNNDDDEYDKVISYLVSCGADTNTKDNEGMSPLIYCLISFSNWSIIDILLSQHKDKKNGPIDDTGLSLIHLHCLRNNFDLVKECLEQGIDANIQIDSKSKMWPGYTPLHFARDDLKICKLLFEFGANSNIQNAKGETPVHLARENLSDEEEIFMLMLAHADKNVNPIDSDRVSHLHIACKLKNGTGIVEEFLKNKVDINQPINFFAETWSGYTTLHVAIEYKVMNTIELLLKNGADTEAENARGLRPIHHLIESFFPINIDEQKQILSILLQYGTDINARNLAGDTLLDLCIQRNQLDIFEVVPKNKLDLNVLHPSFGVSPLYTAIMFHQRVWNRVKYTSLVDILLSWGADINFKSKNGRSSIHYCLEEMFYAGKDKIEKFNEFIRYLMTKGADINARDNDGKTPLHLAVSPHINLTGLKILIDNGVDINIEDNSGKVAIEYLTDDTNVKALTEKIEKLKADGSFVHEQNEAYYKRVVNSKNIIY